MRRKVFIVGVVVATFGIGSGVMQYWQGRNQPPQSVDTRVHFSHDITGVRLAYEPAIIMTLPLTDQDKTDLIILRLSDRDNQNKPFLYTVRYQSDLARAAAITKQSLLDHLENAAQLTLPKKDGYSLVKSERITVSGRQSISITFTYTANENVQTKQRLLIIPLNSDSAMYIAQQAKVSDYDNIENEIFNPILKSIEL